RQVLPVSEVRDPLDAEDERGADAREGEDGAGDETVPGQLEEIGEHVLRGPRPRAGHEERVRPGRHREIARAARSMTGLARLRLVSDRPFTPPRGAPPFHPP